MTCIALAIAFAATSQFTAQSRPPKAERDSSRLVAVVNALSADSMAGRAVGTRRSRDAATYIARLLAQTRARSFVPGFSQDVPVRELWIDTADAEWAMTPGRAGPNYSLNQAVFRTGTDFLPLPGFWGLPLPRESRVVDAPVVFGGRLGSRDAVEPKNAVGRMIVFSPPLRSDGLPDFQVWKFEREITSYRNAAAVIIAALDVMPPSAASALLSHHFELEGDWKPRTIDAPPVAIVSRIAASIALRDPIELFKSGFAPTFNGATLRFGTRSRDVNAANVIAILDGRDPTLKNEYVVLTASLDHLGIAGTDQRVENDSIFNGADGSTGAAALLDIVQRVGTDIPRPARSIVFVWTAGESKGQLGSRWFVEHAPIPRDKIIANINVDMIGRGSANDIAGGGPSYLQVVGSRRLSGQFGAWVDEVNKSSGANFNIDYSFDAPGHPARYNCNGDHWNFARFGIPNVFITTGTHADYNTVKDEVDKIDFSKLGRVADFIGALATDIANRPARPVVDAPTPDPKAPCVQ